MSLPTINLLGGSVSIVIVTGLDIVVGESRDALHWIGCGSAKVAVLDTGRNSNVKGVNDGFRYQEDARFGLTKSSEYMLEFAQRKSQ